MTKIENVFMLSIDASLDYETLRKVCVTGHSRIPIYEEIECPTPDGQSTKLKKIVGVLLVKQVCGVFAPSINTSDTFPSVFSSTPVMQFLYAVFSCTEYHPSRRMSPSLVFSIDSRKVVRTWPLSRVHR